MKHTIITSLFFMLMASLLYAATSQPETGRVAVIETNKGTIKAYLYEKDAPITTKNFIELADRKFYDGLKWHRVVPRFVIQGGDPSGNGTGGSEKKIQLEVTPKLRHNAAGILAMARTNDPNSATSQFYITLEPQPMLDMNYAVFGKVFEGLDVIQKIQQGDVMKTIRIIDPSKPDAKEPKPVDTQSKESATEESKNEDAKK